MVKKERSVEIANYLLESVGFISFVLLCLIKPDCINDIESLHLVNMVYSVLQIVCSCFILIIFLIKSDFSYGNCWIIGIFLLIIVSSYYSPIVAKANVKSMIKTTLLCLLFSMGIRNNRYVMLKACRVLNVYVIIDFITVIVFPKGMYANSLYKENWFLGYKNPQMRLIITIVFLSILSSYILYDCISYSTGLVIISASIISILTKSSNGLIGLTILILLSFFFSMFKAKIYCSIIAMCLSATFSFLFINIPFGFTRVTNLVNAMGKTRALSGRLLIWSKSLLLIRNRMFLGYGMLNSTDYTRLLGKSWALHPHNFCLYLLMTGGIILFAVFFIGVIVYEHSLKIVEDSRIVNLFEFVLLAFLFIGLTESLSDCPLLFVIIVLGIECPAWVNKVYDNNYSRHFRVRILSKGR